MRTRELQIGTMLECVIDGFEYLGYRRGERYEIVEITYNYGYLFRPWSPYEIDKNWFRPSEIIGSAEGTEAYPVFKVVEVEQPKKDLGEINIRRITSSLKSEVYMLEGVRYEKISNLYEGDMKWLIEQAEKGLSARGHKL